MRAVPLALAALLPAAALAQTPTAPINPPPSDNIELTPTPAQPPSPPFLSGNEIVFGGEFLAKLQGDVTTPNRSKTRVGVFTDAELNLYANYGKWLSLNSQIKLERARNNNIESYFPDRNTFFRSEIATLRQLYATVRPVQGLSIYAGKIHPAFGSAWSDIMPGAFYNFGSDYEQDERIGLGIEYSFGNNKWIDDLRVSFEAFYLDTSVLSWSFPRGPSVFDPTVDRAWRNTRGQFGPSNTGGLNSYTVAIRGGEEGEGLMWQVSFTQQTSREPGARAETGQSVGASYDPTGNGMMLTSRLGVKPFLEYAHLDNFATVPGLERHYVLGGLAFNYAKWNLAFAGGLRRSQGSFRNTDHQENATLTYEILPRLQVGAGLNHVTLAGRGSWTVSPALSYAVKF